MLGRNDDPTWSPDGRYLAYRRVDCDGTRETWRDVVISDPEGNVVTSFASGGWGVAWSPDSTRVAVWDNWSIGVYGLAGERQTLLTGMPPWGEGDPAWSPDGGSLLLGLEWEISLDGSAPRQLPWADRRAAWGTFSPDGSRVAYATRGSFVIASADGSIPQEVFGDRAWFPTWSAMAASPSSPSRRQPGARAARRTWNLVGRSYRLVKARGHSRHGSDHTSARPSA